ncbi:MAG: ATP synthase F1 subunit delta [Bacteroidetes bacterium]|nr:ATP synthase F1 subunit delta [Bacteroidota bacterium]
MRETRITARYAKALFELALEQNVNESVYEDMKLIADVCKSNRDFRLMLNSPIIKTDKKQKILTEIFAAKINKLSLAFLMIIITKRREVFIEGIALQFVELFKIQKGIKTATIQTAIAADAATKAKVIELLKTYTTDQIELVEETKADIIGGFVLKVDNKQFDSSILNKIQKLKKEFNINTYDKKY